VDYVERGITSGPEIIEAAKQYLAPLKEAGVDTLVLGCTHYPLLTGAISLVMGAEVNLVSSAEETAKDLYKVLADNDLLRLGTSSPTLSFRATGDASAFEKLARRFLGPEVSTVEKL
jgi:glutamate racemase